jgi:hypothetical protein
MSFRFAAQFPEFEAKDINGRTWRLEDLRGKFTLIYLWNASQARALATDEDLLDCLPASIRTHLPESVRAMRRPLVDLQRFYDESGNSKNTRQRIDREAESTDAPARGGLLRSSDEAG